ncbi:hypothetical protein HH310_06330 [Actinoplanes sp. TBRC 11911]|uniref:hypothetical protein n=1 Tax=Actinoplanes sp. TBRC 11911 TaxID=2729386 RepID=UPI00145D8C5F|nr:hypothetical protein [Actinoplanes sp. TBRC 11911]NMO50808.1 hypothetical protein [Actinoplanes sp. TBRC 11911]
MKASEILPGAPVRLSGDLRLAEDLVAVHGDAEPVVVPVAAAAGRLGPVYRRVPGGDPVVPTGRVLVRFAGDADRATILRAAGYEVAGTLGYAPDAVWARASDGGVLGALSHLDELAAAKDVVHAEPELLGERAWR